MLNAPPLIVNENVSILQKQHYVNLSITSRLKKKQLKRKIKHFNQKIFFFFEHLIIQKVEFF